MRPVWEGRGRVLKSLNFRDTFLCCSHGSLRLGRPHSDDFEDKLRKSNTCSHVQMKQFTEPQDGHRLVYNHDCHYNHHLAA